jgi:hypothetical protein
MNRFDPTTQGSLRAWLAARALSFGLASTVAAAALAAGCSGAVSSTSPTSSSTTETVPTGGTTGAGGGAMGAGGGAAADGVPCDVAAVLATHCLGCHGHPVAANAPISLVTYAELTAKSAIDPMKTEIERSVIRMQQAQGPMPPGAGPTVPAADIATLDAWISQGMPKGTCGGAGGQGGSGPNPFAAPAKCTSGQTYQGGEGSSDMSPGQACNHCHAQGEGPTLAIAGTVYPSAHEPDDCLAAGVDGAIVEITDANKQVFDLTVSSYSGNFRTHKGQAIATPYTAKVMFQGRVRAMATPQTEGDCNYCHTQSGSSGAPGRILLP